MTADELYQALVALCQEYGFTTEATYESLHNAVDSIVVDQDGGEGIEVFLARLPEGRPVVGDSDGVHEFQPGSGPLPDSDPEACDVCGERDDHWRHHVDQDDDEHEPCEWFVNTATTPSWCCNTHMYDGTFDFPATGAHPAQCPFTEGID